MSKKFQVVIVGGGTAGITVAARLMNEENPPSSVAIIEPSDKHWYQPLWTLVGGGVFPKEDSMRDEGDFIPDGVEWIKDKVTTFAPDDNKVETAKNGEIGYDALIVCPGIQIDWGKIEGLKDTLGKNGVASNYSYDHVDQTWAFLEDFGGGNAIFTYPDTPIKCAGAPQKIMWLAEHHFNRIGVRSETDVYFASAGGGIFGVAHYGEPLGRLVKQRDIKTRFKHTLKKVDGKKKKATFDKEGEEVVMDFDFIHVTPPMSAPDFIKKSPIAAESGWVDVDKHTTQHNKYKNVFSLGDASSLPCSKTGAAIRKQAPVTVENVQAFLKKRPLTGSYDGYASCPLVTGYGRLILAEFGYGGVPMESFPFDQRQERYSMWLLKTQGLPNMYWHGMLRGRA